jgi:YD repeat-containing protein
MRLRSSYGAVVALLIALTTLGAYAQSAQIQYVYDELGRLIAVIDPSGDTALYSYDAVGNILSIARHATSQVSIISFSPTIGPVGTAVAITGTGFSATASQNTVTFNGTAASVSSATATTLVATVPTGASTGYIAVTTPGGSATSSAIFTVQALATPTITSFTPTVAVPDTSFSITGTNFEPTFTRNVVAINSRLASVSAATGTSISAAVPYNGTSGHVSVATAVGTATSTSDFYVVPSPYVVADVQFTGRATNGTPLSVSLSTAGKIGLAIFDGTAGQLAGIQFSSNTVSSLTVTLLSPAGDSVTSTSVSSQSSFNLTAWLTQTGSYTLLLVPAATASGSMTISFNAGFVSTSLIPRPTGSIVDGTQSLSTGLVGLFVMNEGSGTSLRNVLDGRTSSLSGSSQPTWNTSDPSVVFGGGTALNSYVNAGGDPAFDRIPISQTTIVAKVFVNTIANAGLCEKNDGNTIDSGFVFGFDSSGAVKLAVERSTINMRVASATGAMVTGKWLQVAFTWDGTVGTAAAAHLFMNGTELPKATSTDGSGTFGHLLAADKPFRIGTAAFEVAGALNGKMAYMAVYRGRILTSSELAALDTQLPLSAANVLSADGATKTSSTTSAGQVQQFHFSGAGTQSAGLQFTSNTLGSVTVTVLNPNQTTLTAVTSSASSFAVPRQWLPAFGGYTVNVQPGASATGSITASAGISDMPLRPSNSTLNSSSGLAASLVGLFLMNEATGTTDANVVNTNTASRSGTNSPSWNTTDPSLVFNGGSSLNSHLNAGTDLAFDQLPTSQVTIVAKVYVNTVASGGIAEKNDGNTINSGFVFGWNGNGAFKLTIERSVTNMNVATANNTIASGRWMQVAFTWNGAVGNASAAHLFIDGVEQTKTTSGDGSGTIGYSNATSQPFRIGSAAFDVSGSLNGKLAYLAVYRGRVLTTSEMNQLDAQLPIQ